MKRLSAYVLAVALAAPGCAATQRPRLQTSSASTRSTADARVLAEFAQQLPPGARVRATVSGNRTIRGTLLKATDTSVFIQPRARIAEPVAEIPLGELVAIEQEGSNGSSNTGKAIAAGAAAGAGAALGIILMLIAIAGD